MPDISYKPSAKELITAQIDMVQQIIEHETWYEAERRHEQVDSTDPVVMTRVNAIILECGHDLRMQAIAVLSENR